MADARLSLYYQDESSGNENNTYTLNQGAQAHQSLSANESSHSEVASSGEERRDAPANAPAAADDDNDVRESSSTDGDVHNAGDNNHLASHSSSSGEESDENWESLDYVR